LAGRTALDILHEAAAGAEGSDLLGVVAPKRCIQGGSPNPTGATPIHELVHGRPIIKRSRVPPDRGGDDGNDRSLCWP